jgi:hypothetical protein
MFTALVGCSGVKIIVVAFFLKLRVYLPGAMFIIIGLPYVRPILFIWKIVSFIRQNVRGWDQIYLILIVLHLQGWY